MHSPQICFEHPHLLLDGQTWNESAAFTDPLTGRRVRRLTTRGVINQTPTYHTNSGFSVGPFGGLLAEPPFEWPWRAPHRIA